MAHHDWPEDFDDQPRRISGDLIFAMVIMAILVAGLMVAVLYAKGIVF